MIKNSAIVASLLAVVFYNAQNVSVIRNTVDVYNNSNSTGSAKYQAMAGSMGALGGEFSTLNSNPAGIGVAIANDFSATLSIANNKNSTSFNNLSNSYKTNNTNLGNIGGIVVFRTEDSSPWKFVNVGVNYSYQSIENYIETPENRNINFDILDDDNTVIDNESLLGHAYNRYGNTSKMSIGLGTNYDNKLYFGAGLNFHSASLEQYDTAAFASKTYNATDFFDKQDTPFSESSTGFSASVGVIGKVSQNFRLGAAIETPTWWTISRDYNFYGDSQYGDGVGTEDRKLSTPLKATLSAAYVANKDFSLNIDYTLGLSKPKYKVYGDAETELNDFFNDNFKNSSELKLGAEYRIADFRLRGGYGFSGNPFDAISLDSFDANGNASTVTYKDIILAKRNTIAAGIGYNFNSFYIDAAYQNVSSTYSNPFLQGFSDYNSGYFSPDYIINSDVAAVSKVKNNQNNFFLTLGWKF